MADYVMAANGLADLVMTLVPTGQAIKVYVGWPDKQTLDADLAAGTIHVSVWPLPMEKQLLVTKADMDWQATGPAQATRETQRRLRQMQISIWANTPDARDTLGASLEAALSDLSRFPLADGSTALLSYGGGKLIDDRQTANLYRRDINLGVNYALTVTQQFTPIEQITIDLTIEVTGGAVIGTIPIITT